MDYVLTITNDGRVQGISKQAFIPKNAIVVSNLPKGEITDYIYQNGEYIYSPVVISDIEEIREEKLIEISNACNKAITAGIDVETSRGKEHFSLEETDQINLNAAAQAVGIGATTYPYHADKQLCRMFTAEEITAVVQTATQHKIYHTTLCNHLLVWARRAETVEELESISYNAESLPGDLALNMSSILAES